MKTSLISLALIAYCAICFAQPYPPRFNNEPEDAASFKNYRSSIRQILHQPLHGAFYAWEGGNWVDYSEDYAYTYNNQFCALASDTQYLLSSPISLNTYTYVDTGIIAQYYALNKEIDHYGFIFNTPVLNTRQVYLWDAYGYLLASTTISILNGITDTVSARIYERTFDPEHRPLTRIRKTYNTSTHQFDISDKIIWIYNPDSTIKGNDTYTWNGSSFDPVYRATDYIYNSYSSNNGVLTFQLSYERGQVYSNGDWVDYSQGYYFYDENGSDSAYIEVLDPYTSIWKPAYNWVSIYDTHGKNIRYTDRMWDGDKWVTNYENQFIYTYDADENPVQKILKEWDYINETVVNYQKYDYTGFITCESLDYVEEANKSINDICIYPNPSGGIFTIQLKAPAAHTGTATLYDINGRPVYSGLLSKGSVSVNIDMKNAAPGCYLLKVISAGTTCVKRIEIIK